MLLGSRRAAAFSRFTFLSIGAGVAILGTFLYIKTRAPSDVRTESEIHIPADSTGTYHAPTGPDSSHHPIDTLIKQAEGEWSKILAKETHNVEAAAQEYRARRGRHPPPGFGEWFEYAKSHDAIMVEYFFDQIHHDLNPYWAIKAQALRKQARTIQCRIVVRDHEATFETDAPRVWMDSWYGLVESIQEHLPDVDMPINVMDESRLVVPWETLAEYIQKERSMRNMPKPEDVVTEFNGLSGLDAQPEEEFDPEYLGPSKGPFWNIIRKGCPEDSAARNLEPFEFSEEAPPPEFPTRINSTYHGYVSNWTETRDPCKRPELQPMHGSFIEPISISTSHKLFPMFGGSKLTMNNEILIPPAMYWADDEHYSGGDHHGGSWDDKMDRLVWRGAATGGRHKRENWTGFQRQRFLSMINSTAVHLAEAFSPHAHPNFVLPDYRAYRLAADRHGRLAEYVEKHSDAGFVHLNCHPVEPDDKRCSYIDHYFEIKSGMPMKSQYDYKFLPDIDGNSFSGRYLGFLLSSSLPIKATIYNEWHDSRLVPWAHFVPMDSTFLDIYGILEYFIGYEEAEAHDSAGEKIALDGQDWASKVLRPEDMQIYVYRLLLEYARLCDDQRNILGYVDDLKST